MARAQPMPGSRASSRARTQEHRAERERAHEVDTPAAPEATGRMLTAIITSVQSRICRFVSCSPRTTGGIGMPAAA